ALINRDIHVLGGVALAAKTSLASISPNNGQIHTYLILGDPALQIQIHRHKNVFLPVVMR
ncbi:MAG: hypothetical protein GYA34_09235, partial [Chloroflexi bacterium]|nr:hypothetical protein [Chloroflexota bacterium]